MRSVEIANTFFKIENECNTKGLLTFNKEIMIWEVVYSGKNKHFKIMSRD